MVGLISHKSPAVFVDWVTVSFVPRSGTRRFRSEVIKCRDRHVARYRISGPRPLLWTYNMILTLLRKPPIERVTYYDTILEQLLFLSLSF